MSNFTRPVVVWGRMFAVVMEDCDARVKIEPTKAKVDVLAVDAVEKPSAN